MTEHSFREAVAAYNNQFCSSDASLAEKICKAGNVDQETGKIWAAMLLEGFRAGRKMMKAQDGKTYEPAKYFCYSGAERNTYEFRRKSSDYLQHLPALFESLNLEEQADRTRRIIGADCGMDAQELAAEILNGNRQKICDRLVCLLTDAIQKEYTEMFISSYRFYSRVGLDEIDLTRDACFLLAGLSEGMITPEQAQNTAFELGLLSGATREAVYQAASAFDHQAYEKKLNAWYSAIMFVLAMAVMAVIPTLQFEGLLSVDEKFGSVVSGLCVLLFVGELGIIICAIAVIVAFIMEICFSEYEYASKKIPAEGIQRVKAFYSENGEKPASEKALEASWHPVLCGKSSIPETIPVRI